MATSLLRVYQPLIGFQLGIIAMWDAEPCPCGRNMLVIKEVLGRIEDVLIRLDDRQMVRFHSKFVNQPHVCEVKLLMELYLPFVSKWF